jgi:hypothetical protein
MISTPSILAAGIKRFIPGVVVLLLGTLVLSASRKDITIGPPQILGFTQLTLSMFAGYVAGLALMRRRTARNAPLTGARSAVAGSAATLVLVIADMLHGSPTSRWLNCAFAFAAGAAVTVVLFAPWMTRHARRTVSAQDLDVIEAAESVLADRPTLPSGLRAPRPTKTPRQNSPIRAD